MDDRGRPRRENRDRQENIPLSNVNPGYEDYQQYEDDRDPRRRQHYPEHHIPVDRTSNSEARFRGDPGRQRYPEHHIPLDRMSPERNSGSDIGTRPRSQWAKEESMRDTAILLESLPSKQLERMASEIAHGGTWKQRPSRKKSHHGAPYVPRGKDVADGVLQNCEDDPDYADNVEHDIKGMTMNLSQKRRVKSSLSLKKKGPKHVSKWKRFKYSCSITWKHFKYKLAEFAYFFRLWRGHLKKIEGHFGTGVLSYFLFLKWLFYINIPVFLITLGFVILPQVLYQSTTDQGYSDEKFTGKELITGAYWFTDTELYYGFYTSEKITLNGGDSYYNMKYAYLFTCGGYYILCLIILAVSISRSYKKNYIEGSGAFDFYYVSRVFCGWDYGITAKQSAMLKHKSIFNELQEYLSGSSDDDDEDSMGEKCKWFFIRVFTNLLIFGLIGGSCYLIYHISVDESLSVDVDIPVLSEMATPLCVSGVNLILPFFFSIIAQAESYKKPKNQLYINMTRTMLLKAGTLAVLVYYWYQKLNINCWETFVGQEIYRLVIVDFLFILFTTFFMEFIRSLMARYCCPTVLDPPEFEIGRNTLNLIYSQALCWLGTYFCPMLSLIMIIKLFLLFYVKRISVIQNCRPSLRPWRAARSHTIFLAFLLCFFILTTTAVTSAVIFLKPSDICGPFINHTTSYEIVVDLVDGFKEKYNVLHTIIKVISSSGFIAGSLVFLFMLTYYMRIVMVGHKEMVALLRQQLSMEGRDKAYLLKMLQDAHRKHKTRPGDFSKSFSPKPEVSGTVNSISTPGGRQFIKQIASTAERSSALDSYQRKPKGPTREANAEGRMRGTAPL